VADRYPLFEFMEGHPATGPNDPGRPSARLWCLGTRYRWPVSVTQEIVTVTQEIVSVTQETGA
jgi:hypothetical protein